MVGNGLGLGPGSVGFEAGVGFRIEGVGSDERLFLVSGVRPVGGFEASTTQRISSLGFLALAQSIRAHQFGEPGHVSFQR
jgi:hypothetical protein